MRSPDRLRAESVGYLVHPWEAARGRVHSAYDGAVNVLIGGRIHSVVPSRLPDGPLTIRLTDRQWRCLSDVRADDAAALRGAALRIGGAVIDLRQAPVWRPRPASGRAAPGSAERAAALGDEALRRGGAGWIPPMLRSVLESDEAHLGPAVAAMVGRGIGLTPSGDDALIGAMALCLRMGEGEQHDRLAAAVRLSAGATTDLSAHFLRLAADGHLIAPVAAAADALTGTCPAAPLALFDLGATSGADCALGMAVTAAFLDSRQATKVAL